MEAEKQQTAVEWLLEWMDKNDYFIGNSLLRAVEQAKEVDKKQKKYFFECGRNFQLTGEGTFEEAYNETFKSE